MKSPNKLTICISTDEESLLTPRKMYQILPDEKAARSDYIRIIDDEGDDYLYPKNYFVFASFPKEIEAILIETV